MSNKIRCELCGEGVHAISLHIKKQHDDYSLERYTSLYPDAPLFSKSAEEAIRKKKEADQTNMAVSLEAINTKRQSKSFLHDIFKIGDISSAKSASGGSIPIDVLGPHDFQHMVPEQDLNQIWDVSFLKDCMMGLELNIPAYVWGHTGTGKTTAWEQMAYYTNRPVIRVQHTANTMESDLTGTWTAKDGETIFQLGSLAMAMKYGWMYLADEYDFAFPGVLAVYQPILEGKALVIKEADYENRIIHPHPNFRFVATGNTNGTGDESGLYRGTLMQNAANYSRFGICLKLNYMEEKAERRVLEKQAEILKDDAERLVKFANDIRSAFESRKIGSTIGPRELIYAGKLGSRKGSIRSGLEMAWLNKLSMVDMEAASKVAQRHFG